MLPAQYLKTLAVKCRVAPNPGGGCPNGVGEGCVERGALQGVRTSPVRFRHSRLVAEVGPSWPPGPRPPSSPLVSHRNALVCSHDHLTLFLTLVSGLEFIRFDLDLDAPYLDLAPYMPDYYKPQYLLDFEDRLPSSVHGSDSLSLNSFNSVTSTNLEWDDSAIAPSSEGEWPGAQRSHASAATLILEPLTRGRVVSFLAGFGLVAEM